jgi:hypothetical protein
VRVCLLARSRALSRSVWDAQGCVDAVGGMLDGPAPTDRRDEKGVTNRLVFLSVRERGCRDNVSVLLLRFCPTRGGASDAGGGMVTG